MVKENKSQFFVKRLAVVAVAFAMLFAVFIGTGCAGWRSHEFSDGDFVLEISVDRTNVSVGDIIEVTARLTNNSGHDVPIMFFGAFGGVGNLENAISVNCQDGLRAVATILTPFFYTTFRHGATVYRTQRVQAFDNRAFELQAKATLYVGTVGLFNRIVWSSGYQSQREIINNRHLEEFYLRSSIIQIYVNKEINTYE